MQVSSLCENLLEPWELATLPLALRERNEVRAHLYAVIGTRKEARDLEDLPRCRSAYVEAFRHNVKRWDVLEEIAERMARKGVRAVPVKGALLARTHYGDAGARPMKDLDLVCLPSDLEGAIEALRGAGFRMHPHPGWRRAQGAVHDVRLARDQVLVEVHFRLWHELRIGHDAARLVASAHEIPFGRGRVLAPTPADHLFVVVVHAALHAMMGNPLWMWDAMLIAKAAGEGTWEEALERACGLRAELPFRAAAEHLTLVFPRLGPNLPATHGAALRRRILRECAPMLFKGEEAMGLGPSRVLRSLLVERPLDFVSWAREKAALWWANRSFARPS